MPTWQIAGTTLARTSAAHILQQPSQPPHELIVWSSDCDDRDKGQLGQGSAEIRRKVWHSGRMKALKSPLASELLADPTGRVALRNFLVNPGTNASTKVGSVVARLQFRRGAASMSVDATVGKKAKTS